MSNPLDRTSVMDNPLDRANEQSGDPFTEEERQLLRAMIEHERHMTWLAQRIKIWGIAILSIIGAIVTLRDYIKDIFSWFLR